jgi:hypothetical protein
MANMRLISRDDGGTPAAGWHLLRVPRADRGQLSLLVSWQRPVSCCAGRSAGANAADALRRSFHPGRANDETSRLRSRGQGQRYGAVDAVCFEGKCCSRAELIGQRSLDQRSSLAGATNRGRHLDAAFSPVNMKPSLACLFRDFLAPADDEMSIRLLARRT